MNQSAAPPSVAVMVYDCVSASPALQLASAQVMGSCGRGQWGVFYFRGEGSVMDGWAEESPGGLTLSCLCRKFWCGSPSPTRVSEDVQGAMEV